MPSSTATIRWEGIRIPGLIICFTIHLNIRLIAISNLSHITGWKNNENTEKYSFNKDVYLPGTKIVQQDTTFPARLNHKLHLDPNNLLAESRALLQPFEFIRGALPPKRSVAMGKAAKP